MLGKQAWQFIQYPDALVSRIFKAKYFRHVDLFEANLGHNPSYTWQSLYKSIPLLKASTRWRIGSGESIKFWGHPWIRYDK